MPSVVIKTIGIQGPAGTAALNYPATSTTSLAIGTGSKTFTTQAGKAYTIGTRVRAASTAGPTNFMEGVVTSYTTTSLVVLVDLIGGSGTQNDWNINLAGNPGTVGATGAAGTNANVNAQNQFFFGDGADGDVSISSGITTLTTDMYYRNLTISGTGSIYTSGNRIFVSGILDLTAAPTGAINFNGVLGNNSTTATGGATQTLPGTAGTTVGGSQNGLAGGNSNTVGTGSAVATNCNGGAGGSGGAGLVAGGAFTGAINTLPTRRFCEKPLRGPAANFPGGIGGCGGGGGTSTQAGGGGGGSGGAVVWVSAATINRGGSTAVAAIQSSGGNGGNGCSTATAAGVGGGGGGGGSGGWLLVNYGVLTGSTGTNILGASGGTGGSGGNSGSGATGANGGNGGNGGRITIINLTSGTSTESTGSTGTTGSAGSGQTGGAGGAGNTFRVNL